MPTGNGVPGALLRLWRDAIGAERIAAAVPLGTREVRTDARSETTSVRAVTPELFSVLGVRAEVGETFSDRAFARDDAPPAVLSHRLWQTLFDGRADVVGRAIWIEGRPHTIIGVLPARFWYSSMDAPVWTPLDPATLPTVAALETVVRRPPGVTPQRLAEQLDPGLRAYVSTLPANERRVYFHVSGIEGTPLGRAVSLALPWLLGSAVFLTLLIACANVAILVIAQWTAREHEIAIRAALGGSRGRIVRLLLTESIVIAAAGGLLGVCATAALIGIIMRNAGPMVRFFDLSIDPAILMQAMLVTLASGLLAGLGPAIFETRRLHGNPLRSLASSDRVRQRWRQALVAMEIAVTVALLVVTTTMVEGYRRNLDPDVGFVTDRLLTARVENQAGVDSRRIVDALSRVPGIASAAASSSIPFGGSGGALQVRRDRDGSEVVNGIRAVVGPGFFTTLGVSLRSGRAFTAHDGAARIVIVNEALARRLWPSANPVGQRLLIGDAPHEVVGVVADYKNHAFETPAREAKLFLPVDTSATATTARFLIRSQGDPAPIVRSLRREIANAVPGTVVTSANTIDEVIKIGSQEVLAGTAPLVPLVATGLLLTTAGIYGVLAFAITRRARELALRVAMGATGARLVRLVTAQSLRLVGIGAAGGICGTYALTRVMRAAGGAGSMFDPTWPAFVVPAMVIVVVGALASWMPARRALRIDPATLLRSN